jgi:predicted ester cyclase
VVLIILDARNRNDFETFATAFPDEWRESIQRSFGSVTDAFPDIHITPGEMIAEGHTVALHWAAQATHLGTWQGIAPTGKVVRWTGTDLFTLTDGKITGVVREQDTLGLLRQLGVSVTWEGQAIT